MRAAILASSLLLIAPLATASLVIHDGAPGIIAYEGNVVLDSNGHVWNLHQSGGWLRWEEYDPPVPVEQIMFWNHTGFVTIHNEAWRAAGGWVNHGTWPDLPTSIEERADPLAAAAVSPNPTAGACRIAFSLDSEGPVSVRLFDAAGRLVRGLLEGRVPAGDFSLRWDGRDDAGREVPAGTYFTRIEARERVEAGKVVLAR